MEEPLLLGVDPSLASLGYAVASPRRVFEVGTLRTSPKKDRGERLVDVFVAVRELLERWHPCRALLESQFAGRNIETLKAINQVTGVVWLACSLARIPVSLFPPSQIKHAATGHGRATKQEVAEAVLRYWAGDPCLSEWLGHSPHGGRAGHVRRASKTDDVTDALACILTFLRLRSSVGESRQ